MTEDEKISAEQALAAFLTPLARLMIDNDIMLNDAVELLKSALIEVALAKSKDVSASQVSLMTGVHRKDVKRIERHDPQPEKSSAAARVLTLWQTDPDFQTDGQPRDLPRPGDNGFDALVKRAKIDAASATVLAHLKASKAVEERDGLICFLKATFVPDGHSEMLKASVATLVPHLMTTVGNLAGDPPQLDQALRYSHLSEASAKKLNELAGERALELLKALNVEAQKLQASEEGGHTFALGTYIHTGKENS